MFWSWFLRFPQLLDFYHQFGLDIVRPETQTYMRHVDFSANSDFAQNLPYSPPFYPSPWQDASVSPAAWQEALKKAQAFVGQLTLLEKVNLTTGVG